MDDFWAMRGKAIQAYASLEQSLARLFSYLGSIEIDVAQIVFFRISSTDSRNKILEKLFQRKFGANYNLFRNSLFEQLRPVNTERNEIVHWQEVNKVGGDENGFMTSTLVLMPPAGIPNQNSPQKDRSALLAFIAKCDFYSRLINMFQMATDQTTTAAVDFDTAPWLDIFSRPIVYPPPANHPLCPTVPAPDSQPQSSQE